MPKPKLRLLSPLSLNTAASNHLSTKMAYRAKKKMGIYFPRPKICVTFHSAEVPATDDDPAKKGLFAAL